MPPDVQLIGSTLTTTAQLVSANTDGDLSNNTAVSAHLVTGCFDPNDKRATTSTGNTEAWILNADEWIDYTIRFQNTGTDTAFNVVITDRLPTTLDPGSIEWGAASHPHTRQLQEQGVLKFIFAKILLPDSNVNEPASHGHVVFSIGVLPGAPSGTQIDNEAEIHFDVNAPVQTNTVMNTLIDCSLFDASIAFIDNLYLQATEGDAYQWYLNGEAITGAVQRELFFVENGSYSVVVTSAFGCSAVTPPYEVGRCCTSSAKKVWSRRSSTIRKRIRSPRATSAHGGPEHGGQGQAVSLPVRLTLHCATHAHRRSVFSL